MDVPIQSTFLSVMKSMVTKSWWHPQHNGRTGAAAGRREVRTWSVSAQGVALDSDEKTMEHMAKPREHLKTTGKSSENCGRMVL